MSIEITGCAVGGTPVLGRVSLTLTRGETVALTGPSGVGKSTLLRCVLGLERGYTGTVGVAGRCAAVFQDPALMGWRSVSDNICLPTGVDAGTARDLLDQVGLAGRGGDWPGQLSLGQQRRVALARALAAAPDLLCLDEPFVSLDPARAQEMIALVATLRAARGMAILLVTHDRAEAEALADRVLELRGQPAQLRPSN